MQSSYAARDSQMPCSDPHIAMCHSQGSSAYSVGDIAHEDPAVGEVDSAAQQAPAVPAGLESGASVTEADVHAVAAWLLFQLAPFCGRHMLKVLRPLLAACGVDCTQMLCQ